MSDAYVSPAAWTDKAEAQLLTVPEVCAALRVSRWSVYQLIRSKRLKTIKLGARRLVPAASVRALIAELQAEGTD